MKDSAHHSPIHLRWGRPYYTVWLPHGMCNYCVSTVAHNIIIIPRTVHQTMHTHTNLNVIKKDVISHNDTMACTQ